MLKSSTNNNTRHVLLSGEDHETGFWYTSSRRAVVQKYSTCTNCVQITQTRFLKLQTSAVFLISRIHYIL